MGRRRNRGEVRSAGSGRTCPHPPQDRRYQMGGDVTRQRCHRCGADLLPLDDPEDCTVFFCGAPATHWLARHTSALIGIPYCARHAADRDDWIVIRTREPAA